MLTPPVKFALGMAGMPPELVAELEAALPAAQRLIAAYQKMSPDITKAKPDLDTVAPVIGKILAFIQK